jgi:hypothetical protein
MAAAVPMVVPLTGVANAPEVPPRPAARSIATKIALVGLTFSPAVGQSDSRRFDGQCAQINRPFERTRDRDIHALFIHHAGSTCATWVKN